MCGGCVCAPSVNACNGCRVRVFSVAAFRYLAPLLVERGPLCRILVLGCGNSELSAVLYRHGYINITNLDWSAVVVDMMQEKYMELEGVKCTSVPTSACAYHLPISRMPRCSAFCGMRPH
jgi:hypothetical protein